MTSLLLFHVLNRTQVLGGYFSDRIGGQRVIFLAAVGWSLITFYMPELLLLLPRTWKYTIHFIVAIRILNGACQGVHFPSMISLTSQVKMVQFSAIMIAENKFLSTCAFQNLNANERSSYFSLLHCGSAFGTLLTGIMGSFLLDYFGWQIAFRIIGFLGIAWALMMRYYTMSSDRNRVIHVSIPSRLCATNAKGDVDTSVPWLKLFARPCFWAMVITHACENNCFFVLLSWLPTYFHDAFPQAKGWVVNMVPWLAMPPCILIGKYMTGELLRREWSLTSTRKIVQSVCFLSQNVALFTMCHISNFYLTLICMTIVIGKYAFELLHFRQITFVCTLLTLDTHIYTCFEQVDRDFIITP